MRPSRVCVYVCAGVFDAADCRPVIGELMRRVSLCVSTPGSGLGTCTTLYPYQATRPDELSFPKGVTLNIVEKKSQVPPCSARGLLWYHTGWANGRMDKLKLKRVS